MANLGKISSIRRQFSPELNQTVSGSLAMNGLNRFPQTIVGITPHLEKSGAYRTGLDENALYIKEMERFNPEEAAQEKARVSSLREDLEKRTGLDLGPRSDYYRKMYDEKMGTPERAKFVKLRSDKENIFNLDDPHDRITYEWLRHHPDIAPSYQAYLEGKVKNSANIYFFVDDFDHENEVAYKEKTIINKAISTLENMSPEKQFKTARLLGLPVRFDDKPHVIYNLIDTFIKTPDKAGHKMANVNLFNKIISMTDENFHVRFLVEEALKYSVYRVKQMRIYEGETVVAKDKEELIQMLSTSKHQDDLLALEEKIRQKKHQEA